MLDVTPILDRLGKLSSTKASSQKDLVHQIQQATSFLPIDAKLAERVYCIQNSIYALQTCPQCEVRRLPFGQVHGQGYCNTCSSPSCKTIKSINKRTHTLLERYGELVSPLTKQKAKDRAPELQVKAKTTLMERYGVEFASQIPGHKQKLSSTMLRNHPNGNPRTVRSTQPDAVSARIQKIQSKCNTVNVTNIFRVNNMAVPHVLFVCNQCNKESALSVSTFKWRAANVGTACRACSILPESGSLAQQDLLREVQKMLPGVVVHSNIRSIISPYELDIYIPDLNIAVEYDGMIWHSHKQLETQDQINYHLTKTNLCKQLGIQLIHVWESEWITKREIVLARLRSKFGKCPKLGARKCSIESITNEQCKIFMDTYHIQGHANASIRYGLIHNNQIQAVMSFCKSRFNKNYTWELLRYASVSNVQGGAGKLLAHFTKQHSGNILSYSDLRWNTGNLYIALGMRQLGQSAPNYRYFKQGDVRALFNRVKFQKHKLSAILPIFDPQLTEAENMFANGYRRIWDCGNAVFAVK